MLEFTIPDLILMAIAGAVAWHTYATKILGYVGPAEAALRTDWQKFKAEMTGQHAVNHQRIASLENIVHPVASAAISAATAPAAPAAPVTDPSKPTA